VEVPRGILHHHYETDAAGTIRLADCIIPTNSNINNIEADFAKLLPETAGLIRSARAGASPLMQMDESLF
jgi:coenzyme F420-reducing hydrogenase alpha subunit